jgi:hypothetical protein
MPSQISEETVVTAIRQQSENFSGYTIQSIGLNGNFCVVFTNNSLAYGFVFNEKSLVIRVANLEREGQDVSLLRKALIELRTAIFNRRI